MAGLAKTPKKSFLQAVMALCMGACFLVSGHPIVVSLGQEATCCADDVCACTSPGGGSDNCSNAAAVKSCCSDSAVKDAESCCGGAELESDAGADPVQGPAWQSRCFCGGDGPVVVVLGSPVRFDAARAAASLHPKTAACTPLDLRLEPESWKPEPKSPVPWKEWC